MMKRLLIALTACFIAVTQPAMAQGGTDSATDLYGGINVGFALGGLTGTVYHFYAGRKLDSSRGIEFIATRISGELEDTESCSSASFRPNCSGGGGLNVDYPTADGDAYGLAYRYVGNNFAGGRYYVRAGIHSYDISADAFYEDQTLNDNLGDDGIGAMVSWGALYQGWNTSLDFYTGLDTLVWQIGLHF